MARVADLGISIGILPSGQTASIADVPGVGVGHATVWRDEPPPPVGRGVARTGVTIVDIAGNLFRRPVPAGGAVLNGAGECTGFLTAAEWGLVETPIFLTSTMQIGRVYDAACELLIEEDPGIGADDVIIPVVAECDDSFLNDARRMQVTKADVKAALDAARTSAGGTAPAEGAVGAGTGMSCLGFKGGIGTASRLVPSGHVVGVLVLSNFGEQDRLTVDGLPAGRLLPSAESEPAAIPPPGGSCIVVTVTDAPLDSAACARLARRAGLGLARTGSTASHGSGEIFLALATGLRAPRGARPDPGLDRMAGRDLNPFFAAVVEATEEAVLNSLLAAPTVVGRDGHVSAGLPAEEVRRLLAAAGRIRPRVRAVLVTPEGELLTIRRVRPGREPYHVLPGGGVEEGEDPQTALARELREEIAATADVHSLLAILDEGGRRQLIYLARARTWSADPAHRTGPEFARPGRGEYHLERVPLDPAALASINLKPDSMAEFLIGHLRAGTDLFSLPDLRAQG